MSKVSKSYLVKDVLSSRQDRPCEEMFYLAEINDLVVKCNAGAMSRLQHATVYATQSFQ